jgi:hypothetical protein
MANRLRWTFEAQKRIVIYCEGEEVRDGQGTSTHDREDPDENRGSRGGVPHPGEDPSGGVVVHAAAAWAEAAERQRLLAEAMEDFAGEKDCVVNVVPGMGDYGGGRGIEGIRGSWLVSETSEWTRPRLPNEMREQ